MTELILTAIGAAIVNNVVLSQFLGICPFLAFLYNPLTSRLSHSSNGVLT